MQRLSISELFPGMITAEDVYSYSNQLILQKGTVLTDKAITKLEFYSIFTIHVEDDIPQIVKPVLPPDTPFSTQVKNSDGFKHFKQDFDTELQTLQFSLNDLVDKNADVDVSMLMEQTLALLDHAKSGGFSVLDMLHNMRYYDDLTYAHSLNVSLLCNVFAGWLNLSDKDVRLVTLCGLLHDIGKLKIPDAIIKKPGKLTDSEFTLMKTHPMEGYRLLDRLDISDHVKNAALMHHERCDGTGYPLQLTSDAIDPFAKIVSIVDVYDAMTAARIYRGPQCPFTVISLFEQEGLQKYDARYIMTFLNRIVNTYLRNEVSLSDGRSGTVIYINAGCLSRPIVKCGDAFVDLMKNPELSITAII